MPDKYKNLTWTAYFSREEKSFFQRLLSSFRKIFLARAVKFYADKYFAPTGIFLEAGAGTSQSSSLINDHDRQLVALDLDERVLVVHNRLKQKIQGNILALPIKDLSLDGIWNLGVMEHFNDQDIVVILKEFQRVLKPEGVILLFWPPSYAPFQIVLNAISRVALKLFRKKIEFFPEEINRYRHSRKLIGFLNKTGLRLVGIHFNILDLFSYKVIVVKK